MLVSIATDFFSLSLQANYTDWGTATARRILVPTFADRVASRDQCGGSPTVVNLSFLTGASTFLPSSSSFIRKRLSGPRSRPTATNKIWLPLESNPGSLGLQTGNLTSRPQRRSQFHTHAKLKTTWYILIFYFWRFRTSNEKTAGSESNYKKRYSNLIRSQFPQESCFHL
jgi:hypothetical protein